MPFLVSSARVTSTNRRASLADLQYSRACRNFDKPRFDSNPCLISVVLTCVGHDSDTLREGKTHRVNFSLAISRSELLIIAEFSEANLRALSSRWLPSSSREEGSLLDRNSNILHTKTPDPSNGGPGLAVRDIRQEKESDKVEERGGGVGELASCFTSDEE
ncbi:hypothetical protein BJV74DRAFT_259776 [Russula compacta]|nr:hypothetical protein BJV74DRAFT_259776 [Russula compacta]